MGTVVAARADVLVQVLDSIGDADVISPMDGDDLYELVRQRSYSILIVDEDIGRGRWKAIASIPILLEGRHLPKVILLARGLDERRERLAAMAGCYDAIDITSRTWIQNLEESVRVARSRVRLLGQIVRARGNSDAPVEAPRISVAAPRPR